MPPLSNVEMPPVNGPNSETKMDGIESRIVESISNHLSPITERTSLIKSTKSKPNVVYHYLDHSNWKIMWTNVIFFALLHLVHFYGLYLMFIRNHNKAWVLCYVYGSWGALGVTAGAHRLWSHRSYKAKLPLRIFLMLGHTISAQNSLYVWCRDHRSHHKFSETDGDPHNSKRGFFFAHMGWLLFKKHPEIFQKGKSLDLSDLLEDPVVRFQKKFYWPLIFTFSMALPTIIGIYVCEETLIMSFLITVIGRLVTSLHSTWFVNSTAHMFGYRPYNLKISPRENIFVSYGAFGEGYHNYHHTFPWDYATSELGYSFNTTKHFIDFMAKIGLAYDLKVADRNLVERYKKSVGKECH
ncbi:stearoyl-CoA desaturase 5-like [Brevipalpus obovatus]|uniref:stearoyl-CoA desaturase 5-like n=1 Tax=Brevipalpus obovatus TaxID=246614 RepID=UPI003D9F4C8C